MFFGPLFTYDLIRLARRGLPPRLRALLVAFLLIGLALLYIELLPAWMPLEDMLGAAPMLPHRVMANFGEKFMLQYLTVQLIAVVLFAPVFTAGGIIEEKNRRTLEFLQASQLRSGEIVLGKFLARTVFVLSILLAGLPVLMFASFFGGIDAPRLLYGFVIAIVEVIFLGSFATMAAMRAKTLGRVLLRTYMMLAATTVGAISCIGGGQSEVAMVSAPATFALSIWNVTGRNDPDILVPCFAVVHLLASLAFLNAAVKRLREPMDATEKHNASPPAEPASRIASISPAGEEVKNDVFQHPMPRAPAEEPVLPREFVDIDLNAPPIGDHDNPIVWKDTHFTGRVVRKGSGMEALLMMLLVIAIYPILLYLFVALVKDINKDQWIGRTVNEVVIVFLELVLIAAPVIAGLRTSASIGTERQQETLLALFTLPWSRGEILGAKWWSAIRWLRGPLRIAAVVLIAGVVLLGVTPYAALCAAVLIGGFLALASSAGLLMSVYCGSVMRATIGFFVVWILAMLGPYFVSFETAAVLSPPYVLAQALEYLEEVNLTYPSREPASRWPALLLGAGYGAVAWLLWRAAEKRFEREGMN